MSRLARYPIQIPQGVSVDISQDGATIKVKGPQGEMQKTFAPVVKIIRKDNAIVFEKTQNTNFAKAMLGTAASIVKNMIKGVKEGFKKELQIIGLGYNFAVSGSKVTINCGYSHPVVVDLPKEIKATAQKTSLVLTSFDKELLGRVAAEIRKIRPPEPYKGKGIRYADEVVRKKVGKAGIGGTGAAGK